MMVHIFFSAKMIPSAGLVAGKRQTFLFQWTRLIPLDIKAFPRINAHNHIPYGFPARSSAHSTFFCL